MLFCCIWCAFTLLQILSMTRFPLLKALWWSWECFLQPFTSLWPPCEALTSAPWQSRFVENLQAGSRPDVSSGVCERGRTQPLEPPDLYLSDPRTVITVVISTLPCQSIQFVFLLAGNHVLHVVAVRYDFYYNFHASKSLILLFLVTCSYRTLSLSTENTLMFSMPANHKRTCRRWVFINQYAVFSEMGNWFYQTVTNYKK